MDTKTIRTFLIQIEDYTVNQKVYSSRQIKCESLVTIVTWCDVHT